jgi:diguanylate cyclase (GGDEF)-like protein/PAS domain S-box-containing protein
MFFTLFLLLLAVSTLVLLGFAFYAIRCRDTPGARPFALALLGWGLACSGYFCELLSATLPAKIVWDNIQFTGIDIAMVGVLLFALDYTRRLEIARRLMPFLWVFPVLNALMIWTDPVHHLVRPSSRLIFQDSLSLLAYTYGPWFGVWVVGTYLIGLTAVGLLAVALIRAPRFYQLQVGAVLVGMLAGLFSGLMTVSGLVPLPDLPYLDITPLAYLIAAPLWAWALFRRRFLDLAPIARDRLVEHMADGLLVVDDQYRVVDINPAAGMLLQFPDMPLPGISLVDLLPSLMAMLTPESIHTTIRHLSPAGSADAAANWLEVHITPLRSQRGQVAGWMIILRDRTAYRRMEEALRTQNARLEQEIADRRQIEEAYRNLVQFSHQGLMILQEGRVVFANPTIESIHGYTVSELQAMSAEELFSLIHPADRPEVQQRMQAHLNGEIIPRCNEHRIVCKQGQTRWVEVYMAPADFRGSPAFQLTFIEITERKQAEEALRASEARLKAIFDNAAVGIALADTAGNMITVNARGAQQLGYTPQEMAHISNLELTHPDDRAATVTAIRQLLRGEITGYRIEKRYITRSGALFWADLSVTPVYNDDGQIAYLLGIVVDITERTQAEEALRASERFVQQIADTMPDILYIYDLMQERTIYSNRHIWEILGYTSAEVQAMGVHVMSALLHPDDQDRARSHRAAQAQAGEEAILDFEYRMRHRDGNWRWLLSREVVFARTADGQPQQILGIAQDITARKQLELQMQEANAHLQEQSIRDALTGLYNRRYLDATLPRELQRAQWHGGPVGVIMLDVDHFKRFNDTHGHDAGDTLLRGVGDFLKTHTRGEDIACRYGGEEFILVLPGAALEHTRQRAEEIRMGIQALVMHHQGQALDTVTISVGVAVFPDSETADLLIRAADQALYQAKRNGRDRVAIAGAADPVAGL